jgi:molybdopterin/thiamine biosynthesis adenylyltransferase
MGKDPATAAAQRAVRIVALTDWTEAHPERLAWELAQFSARGINARLSKGPGGRTQLAAELLVGEQRVDIRVVFPRHFPDTPPKFYATEGLLPRHQHAQGGNLCVADELNWWPWCGAAEVIDEEVRRLLEDSAAGAERVAANEADMPEPLTAHFSHDSSATVLVPDPFWSTSAEGSGGMYLVEVPRPELYLLRWAEGIGSVDNALLRRLVPRGVTDRRGYWAHLDPAPEPKVEGLLERCREANPNFARRLRDSQRSNKTVTTWVGVRFIEEGPRRGERRLAWLFIEVAAARHRPPNIDRVIRAQALTRDERQRRIPELARLVEANAIVVGAGSVGAPVALELSRAGVGKLDVFDPDHYDVNNAVRHVLPVVSAGASKAEALALQCMAINPFIDVEPHQTTVGAESDADAEILSNRAASATVIVDTTGVPSVSRVLQRYASSAEVPLITAGLTAGGYGAELLISRPDGPCHDCLVFAQRDGSVPRPTEGAVANVTPVGCSHPAFIGAGFEASELASVVVRTAVGLIPAAAYPEPDFDWMVLNFRGHPSRQHGRLEIHTDCRRH